MQDKIVIKGAREHNLKNIDLEIPRNKMIVFTGLSGSGKSSLAFDTIFAEGQRRYVESLSAYARQFLGGMQKPDVDEIEGLSPAISIDQKAHGANPRSTVATITEIYDYLRVLFARVGAPFCPICSHKIEKMTVDEIKEKIIDGVSSLSAFPSLTKGGTKGGLPVSSATTPEPLLGKEGTRTVAFRNNTIKELVILSPVVRGRKGEYYQMLYDLYNSGFAEVRIDGKLKSLREQIILSKNNKHTIEVVVDRILFDDINKFKTDKEIVQRFAEAIETAVDLSNGLTTVIFPNKEERIFSTEYSCPNDGFSFPEIEPRLFSFNSPYGYCEACAGLGTKELFSEEICPKCQGKRLNNNALSVRVYNKNIWEIVSMTISEAREFFTHLENNLGAKEKEISGAVVREINNRLDFMFNVGLHYLTLERRAGSLSGGEAQRIRLASQVGTRLVGALYVLDEPTIGLHQKDNEQLVKTLRNLCDIGNTIIVVEHDEDTILASDWVVDIGPGAGKHGGEIVYSGPLDELLNSSSRVIPSEVTRSGTKSRNPFGVAGEIPPLATLSRNDKTMCVVQGDPINSLTSQYLRGEKVIDLPDKRRKVDRSTPKLKIKGAVAHNLKNIDVEIPLRRFVCLTGVSGSGKSTLMHDIIERNLQNRFFRMDKLAGKIKALTGSEYLDGVIVINQSPIGRTPRSNPATYTKAFDHIRELFSATPEARMRGFGPGRFSFNVSGGRCENCEGRGILEIEMHFLPSVQIVCDVCKGKRFNQETLAVHYKGKNISDILNMTVEEAQIFFKDIPQINDKLKMLKEVGLDYLTLGQSATTLSGGEAQRIKLSKELSRYGHTKTLYLLDEPTTGLHYEDVKKLLEVLQRLTSQGNTVMVIEHNLDVIKCADWVIDLGPEGGDKGGEIIANGTPEEIARKAHSHTGFYLRRLVK
jgi:excinuclease ABC subunit A